MRKRKVKSSLELLVALVLISILFIPIILPIMFFVFAIYILRKQKRLFKIKTLEKLDQMSPYEFEEYVALLFKKRGYKTIITSRSRDFGVDVIAKNKDETIAIQVKKYKTSPVGNKDVQMLLGAMHMRRYKANKCVLISTSRFTKNALEQAKGCPIELWNLKKLIKVEKSLQ